MNRQTILDLKAKVAQQEKLVAIAAYTANMSKFADEFADIILVGDSLGMVIYGMESTLPVTLELMINHGKAVVNSSKNAFIIIDMPFGSYQESKHQAFRNAALLLKETGAGAVKIEGGIELVETVEYLSARGVAVIAHLGLLPQHIHKLGGYKVQGRQKKSSDQIVKNANALEKAGVELLLLEGLEQETSNKVIKNSKVPVIGIGASDQCHGQILVIDDLLGISDNKAKFVKSYANLGENIRNALQNYKTEVKEKKFPNKDYLY
jgi:3-methyl-2-oxobutanoate hydroxymethyltransferase